jgi:uncharacterized membrane protein YhaH (DUF805 family)
MISENIYGNPSRPNKPTGFWQTFEFYSLNTRLNRIKFLGLYSFWLSAIYIAYLSLFLSMYSFRNFVFPLILLILVPNLFAIKIRRFHDLNLSAWWIISLFIPFIGAIMGLILIFMPGTKGDNKYGEMPDSALNRYYYIIGVFASFNLIGSYWLSM